MSLFTIVCQQVFLMVMMMIAGAISYKAKWIDDLGVKQISSFLLNVVNPLTIIAAYQISFSMERLEILLKTFIISLMVILLTLLFVKVFLGRFNGVERYGISFANCGFIGIPLVRAILGDGAVFHLSAFLVAINIIVWTYGIYMITGDKKYMTLKKAIFNPGTLGTLFGLLLFFSPYKLPVLVYQGVNTLGNLNTPLAMIILGAYIAKCDVKSLFTAPRLYAISSLRLIILPLITLLILIVVPIEDTTILMTVMIACSAPSAVNTMMFSLQFSNDGSHGAKIVSLTSLLSIITLPLILSLAGMFL